MAIRLMEDVGAPLAVVGVDLITETAAPTWNEWMAYLMAAGGYASNVMGWGGALSKNIGIAALPWAAKKLYNRVRGGVTPVGRLAFRSAGRYAAPAQPAGQIQRSYQREFESTGSHVF